MQASQAKTDYSIDKLNQLYRDSETADSTHFAEQRSNILLVAGEHYTNKNSKYWERLKDTPDINQNVKLRVTKNHIQKVSKTYINNIVTYAPGTTILPKNQREIQHQKAAQLNLSVWQDAKARHNYKKKVIQWAEDYVNLGEVAVKIFWDPNAGKFKGYKQALDETGQPVHDEQGRPVPSEEAVFTGDFVIERIFGANLLRPSDAKDMDDAPFLCIRKMVDTDELKARVGKDPDKLKAITQSEDKTFVVFNGTKGNYSSERGQTLLKEFYFKPSMEFPRGYFFIAAETAILWEGELPFGIFPIAYEGFDSKQTSPRHQSIIKQLRPYQLQINLIASKMAEHVVTVGDDKVLSQSGAKITNGGNLSGVRNLQYTGARPEFLPGRTGDHYLPSLNANISELYQAANVVEDTEEKQQNQDPLGMLFQSMRNKKKFSLYAQKFENFLVKVTQIYLELAKNYYPDDMLIPAIGKNEYVNIQEFRSTQELCYQITVEPQTDDLETMFGKQIAINHALQYVGNKMEKEDIGKLMRAMPFGNFDESFSDLTLDYDTATNMLLALDRGEQVQPSIYDDGQYMIKRLTSRIRQSDFQLLNQQVQQNYNNLVSQYDQLEAVKLQKMKAAESEFIPSGGPRVKVDFYVDGKNGNNERATLPTESISWLIQQLAQQGSTQEQLSQMNQGAVTQITDRLNVNQGQAMNSTMGMSVQQPSMHPGVMPMRQPMMARQPLQ